MDEKLIVAKSITDSFLRLSPGELEIFASTLKRINANKGELLLKEGEVATGIFWVHSGLLRQFYFKGGRDVTEHFSCQDQGAFCIKSIIRKEPTKIIVEALEDSVVYLIPYYELIRLSKTHPVFSALIRKFIERSLILSQEKADSWRFESARERYERFLKEFPDAARRASVNHIASYLLMSPESLSRVRAGTL